MLMFLRTVILTASENTIRRLRRNKAFLAEEKSQGQSTLIKDVLWQAIVLIKHRKGY